MEWLSDSLVWLIPALWGAVEGWRRARGSKAEKAYAAATEAHQRIKAAQWDKATADLENIADNVPELVEGWKAEFKAAEDNWQSLRPGARKPK